MRPSDAYLLPLTTLATLLTVVACGPSKDYVPVKTVPGTPIGQAFAKCAEEIRPSKAKVVNATVSICEVGKDGLYAKVQHTYRYDVQSASSQLQLSIKPGVDYDSEVTKTTHESVKSVLANVCVGRIDGVFQRSLKKGGVSVAMTFNLSVDEEPATGSPMIELGAVTGGPEKAFVIKTWPDRARIYPDGLKKDTDRCAKLPVEIERRRCHWAAIEAANEPFCAQLAVLTGHWLGLKAPKGSDPHCKETSPVAGDRTSEAAAKPVPKPESDSVYMKGAYEMEPKEFFAKAALSRADLKSVFAPACSSFRNLPDESALRTRNR
ncbi:MAG: hypothetical protein V4760_05040 [Bdellovibrionota bacterium]